MRSLLLVTVMIAAAHRSAPPGALEELQRWRAEQERSLTSPESPLARLPARGLSPGHNRLGSGPQDDLRFDSPGVPASAADFVWAGGMVRLEPWMPMLLVDGQPAVSGPLRWGAHVSLGPLLLVLQGGPRAPSLAVFDASLPDVVHYQGLKYLPTDWAYRVPATFTPADAGRTLTVETSTGGEKTLPLKGTLHFELHGKQLSLDGFGLGEHPNDYFVIFKDRTNGKETYGSGRFVWVPGAVDGKTTIDFNLAWNPLCAYSHAFNCPLAPPENRLPVAIPVGEATFPHQESAAP
ncbi:MAG TPA: DUF1684 domain-containing protein [Myxococcales bacterium]|nr:DUF1684 domain-containing protein [Myxococcales bacterium]